MFLDVILFVPKDIAIDLGNKVVSDDDKTLTVSSRIGWPKNDSYAPMSGFDPAGLGLILPKISVDGTVEVTPPSSAEVFPIPIAGELLFNSKFVLDLKDGFALELLLP